jgi:hypothetical protein
MKANPEALVRGFIDQFDPDHRKLIRSVRSALRKRFSTSYEMAYDNYNFVLGYSPTERPPTLLSMAAGARSELCFIHGATFPIRRRFSWGRHSGPVRQC